VSLHHLFHSSNPVIKVPLSDDAWMRVEHLFIESQSPRGRPRRAPREILNAILWIQHTGEKWHRLPASFPPQQTCYARYIAWRRAGTLQRAMDLLGIRQCGDAAA
jgi:transposase